MVSLSIVGTQMRSMSAQIARLLKWILYSRQATLAIVDQAVISISSIALSVVIARAAGIDLLGAVAFILALAVFGGMPVASLISAPAMVLFGSVADRERYRGLLFLAGGMISLPLAAVLSVLYLAYRWRAGLPFSKEEICLVAVLFLLIPVQDILRRTAFASSRAWAGLRLSLIRNIPPPMALLFAFVAGHSIGLFDVLLVMAFANVASIAMDLLIDPLRLPSRHFALQMMSRHWYVSRWLLLSSIFNSTYEQIFTVASGIIFGDRAVAAIRISQQAFGVILAGLQTFENTVPQQLTFAAGNESENYRSLVNLLAGVVFLGVLCCGGLLWWFGNELIWFVFKVDYREYADLLLLWAVAIACSGARSIYAMAFRAVQYTRPILAADTCAFMAGLIAVIPLLHGFGVLGSGIGMLITNFVGLAVLVVTIQQGIQGYHEAV